MPRVATAVLLALAGFGLWTAAVSARHSEDSAPPVAVYDSNPSHLWNRLYAALLVREDAHGRQYGEDTVDPPLWGETEHLLSQPSHRIAIQVLDEFLRTHGENLVHDPLERASLQHDLWAVFDWTVAQYSANQRPQFDKQKRDLQLRLAEALRRLALTHEEINALPDNYMQAVASGAFAKEYDPTQRDRPFLPPDLFDPHGPWVCITPSPDSDSGVASMHIFSVSGRSGFLVFVRLPEGRKATFDYFQTLWNFPQSWRQDPNFTDGPVEINPDLPSFPAGTEVALVRRMTLINNQGELETSSLTESVQIRVYHSITRAEERNFGNGDIADILRNSGQDFYEIKLSRPLLFSGKNGGLRATAADERTLPTFQQMGLDLIDEKVDGHDAGDRPPTDLQSCFWCHSGGGVRSLNSRASLLKPNRRQQEPQNVDYGPIYWSDNAALEWKQNRYDWGLLNGYWKAASPLQ